MDSRLKKSLSAGGRESRASLDYDRAAPEEQSALSDERRKMWKDEWTQSALPNAPAIPGWHLCWLSTTNSYDSIDKRIRLGYVPVKADELPGMENNRVKAGEHVGFIACNEMLLYKIPEDIYQDVMAHFHHEAPLEEANKIRVQAERIHGRDSSGRNLGQVEGEGLGDIDKPLPAPAFV
ncbi:MAG: hypothetical protein EBR82_32905 [Caulobacteraceae bacterium]|jgi:hypothetical protein|nr:hypothetical protein [Caulobacteraceae bacterium]